MLDVNIDRMLKVKMLITKVLEIVENDPVDMFVINSENKTQYKLDTGSPELDFLLNIHGINESDFCDCVLDTKDRKVSTDPFYIEFVRIKLSSNLSVLIEPIELVEYVEEK